MVARLRLDHQSLGRGASDQQAEIRCHLFGLEALLRAHIEREERLLIPLLDEECSFRAEDVASGVPRRAL